MLGLRKEAETWRRQTQPHPDCPRFLSSDAHLDSIWDDRMKKNDLLKVTCSWLKRKHIVIELDNAARKLPHQLHPQEATDDLEIRDFLCQAPYLRTKTEVLLFSNVPRNFRGFFPLMALNLEHLKIL